MTFSVVITGIGGYGVLTAGTVIAQAALAAGLDVRTAELHGLAQRFGPLEMHVRFGKRVASPLVPTGTADLIIGLERLETLRALEFAGPRTAVVFDPRAVVPTLMTIKGQRYPSEADTIRTLRRVTKGRIVAVAATEAVKAAGAGAVTANIYLLGRAAALGLLPLSRHQLLAGIEKVVPPAALEVNRRLFEAGFKLSER